jgi:hypothetical protein
MSNVSGLPLVTPAEYAAERVQVFPSGESFRWFERQHRVELVERGALVKPTGRKLVNPALFDQVVLEIGARQAKRRGHFTTKESL